MVNVNYLLAFVYEKIRHPAIEPDNGFHVNLDKIYCAISVDAAFSEA